jgi:uncharacterized protein (TIGR03067 family)
LRRGPAAGTHSSGCAEARRRAKPRSVRAAADASAFDGPPTPTLERLQGEWIPTHLVQGGRVMPDQWLAFGSRTMIGHELKVVFGGQVMVHAKVRIHEQTTPIAIDYLSVKDHTVSQGLMEWIGDEVRIIMGTPGASRPATFDASAGGTLSQWRRRE